MSSSPTSLQKLETKAKAMVDAVKDDPAGRLELRKKFYSKYGRGLEGNYGFGNSEIAFMEWEISRGVLNPLFDKKRPGSPWWRKVNGLFIYFATLAALIEEENPKITDEPNEVRLWRHYIQKPAAKTWYKAHNASIVQGYLQSRREAEEETLPEKLFINMVLYRVLFAQAMVEGVPMGKLGAVLADPNLPSVNVLVHIPDFYPSHYPLTTGGIAAILHKSKNLEEYMVEVLDDSMIIPHLAELYENASNWLTIQELKAMLKGDIPIYPNLSIAQAQVLVQRTWWEIVMHWFIHHFFQMLKTKFKR